MYIAEHVEDRLDRQAEEHAELKERVRELERKVSDQAIQIALLLSWRQSFLLD